MPAQPGPGPDHGGSDGYPGRVRRFPLAVVLVGVLGLLAAGGAVLGAFEAPTPTDLAVHNGAGQTLAAASVVGVYTSSTLGGESVHFVFTAPDAATETARTATGHIAAHRTVQGTTATGILAPVRALLTLDRFTEHDGTYLMTKPAKALVPPGQRSAVSGSYRVTVHLAAGYVVSVTFRLDAVDQGQHILRTIGYRLSKVGAWTGR